MPKGYRFKALRESGNHSEYESDSGTVYKQQKHLGSGSYSVARLFASPTRGKKKVVLRPVSYSSFSYDDNERDRKIEFFSHIYPTEEVEVFEEEINGKETYRLVLPAISGKAYAAVDVDSDLTEVDLFLAAVEALRDCHQKGLVVVDLKSDNIFYSVSKKKAYLIDGGLSHSIGGSLDSEVFSKAESEAVEKALTKFTQIAPECWSLEDDEPVEASPAMDIYSLGSMMNELLGRNVSALGLRSLINACMQEEPENRPSLSDLQKKLKAIQLILQLREKIKAMLIDFTGVSTAKEITQRKAFFNGQIKQHLSSAGYRAACATLGITETPADLQREIKIKIKTIAVVARVCRLLDKIQTLHPDFSDKNNAMTIKLYRDKLLTQLNTWFMNINNLCMRYGIMDTVRKGVNLEVLSWHKQLEIYNAAQNRYQDVRTAIDVQRRLLELQLQLQVLSNKRSQNNRQASLMPLYAGPNPFFSNMNQPRVDCTVPMAAAPVSLSKE